MANISELRQSDDLFDQVFCIVDYCLTHKTVGGIVNETIKKLIRKERQNNCDDVKAIVIRVASDLYTTIIMKEKPILENIDNKQNYIYVLLKNILLDEAKQDKKRRDIQNGIFDKGMKSIRNDVNPNYYNLEDCDRLEIDFEVELISDEIVRSFIDKVGSVVIVKLLLGYNLTEAIKDIYGFNDEAKVKKIIYTIRKDTEELIKKYPKVYYDEIIKKLESDGMMIKTIEHNEKIKAKLKENLEELN